MSKLRAIGDIHGCINKAKRLPYLPTYIDMVNELGPDDISVQLGDMGFDYKPLKNVSWRNHMFIPGNHENYDTLPTCIHSFGDYGFVDGRVYEFFFVRGGFSIDKRYRVRAEQLGQGKSWWAEEELNHAQGLACLQEYETVKPAVVMSHDCPSSVSNMIGNPDILQAFGWPADMVTTSQELMQQMLDIHRPKLWIFGHYHKNIGFTYKDTHFICVDERHYIDFDRSWNIVGKSF
jgi:hypothetical protein